MESMSLTTGIGHLVLEAVEMRDAGASAVEIVEKLNGMKGNICASFVVERLDYLHKGGRCSSVAALGANLLKLRPCIEVKDEGIRLLKFESKGIFLEVLEEIGNMPLLIHLV